MQEITWNWNICDHIECNIYSLKFHIFFVAKFISKINVALNHKITQVFSNFNCNLLLWFYILNVRLSTKRIYRSVHLNSMARISIQTVFECLLSYVLNIMLFYLFVANLVNRKIGFHLIFMYWTTVNGLLMIFNILISIIFFFNFFFLI